MKAGLLEEMTDSWLGRESKDEPGIFLVPESKGVLKKCSGYVKGPQESS